MEVVDGKIVKATELELYQYWLTRFSDVFSFNEYKAKVQQAGTTIVEDEVS